jgi:predicted esterase
VVRANAERRLASFRAAAAEAEPVVVRPRGHDASVPTPLVIALHGTGGTGRATARAWRAATQRAGALLVAPDALRPAGNGYSWTFRDESEWYVEHLIEKVGEEYAISEVVLVGFSQGANIAFSMGRSHPDLFGAVVPICGHWEADAAAMPRAPAVEEEDSRPSWYLLIGELDPWQGTYDGAFGALGDAGMRVEMKKLPRVGHAMPRTGELLEALRWCLEEKAGEPTRPTRP